MLGKSGVWGAAPSSVCARVSARARLRHDLLPERSQTPRCPAPMVGKGDKRGGSRLPGALRCPHPKHPTCPWPPLPPSLGGQAARGAPCTPGCRRSQRAVGTRTHACVHTSTPTCVFGCTHRRIHTHTRLHVHTHRRAVYVQGHTHAVITYVQEICMHRCAGRGTGTHLGRGKGICIHLYTRRGCAHTVIHMQGY